MVDSIGALPSDPPNWLKPVKFPPRFSDGNPGKPFLQDSLADFHPVARGRAPSNFM